jgi:hypothetical protein
MILNFDQIRKYFEHRHPGQKIGTRSKASVRCAFHDESNASCTLFLDGNGGFRCHGCGAKGNLFQFESRFSQCDLRTAECNVAEITGAIPDRTSKDLGPSIAEYDYRNAAGQVLFQKRRYQPANAGKTFRIFRPNERGGWEWGIDPKEGPSTPRVLFNLPHVVTANVVCVCEGEKDCDSLVTLDLYSEQSDLQVAATCNFDGAAKPGQQPKWLEAYSPYFAGKMCLIFEDNDEAGRAHAAIVAESVSKFAQGVKIISFRDMPEHSDVSDFLATHSREELLARIKTASSWKPEKTAHSMLADGLEFASAGPAETEWLVQDIVQKGGNGIVVAEPKAGKSLVMMDLLLSLVTGSPFLGFQVPRRVRCALISREDAPNLTAQRLAKLYRGNASRSVDWSGWLWVNTRWQTPTFLLEDKAAVAQLIGEMKTERVEFACFDVFRTLHSADENDNTEMQKILQQLTHIQSEVGCAIAVVHHVNKDMGGSIFRRMRGASAIHGWTEWAFGLSVVNPDENPRDHVRKMEFLTKCESPADPVYFRIDGTVDTTRLALTGSPESMRPAPMRNAASLMRGNA